MKPGHNLPTVLIVKDEVALCDILPDHGDEKFLISLHSVKYATLLVSPLLSQGWKVKRLTPHKWAAMLGKVGVKRVAFIKYTPGKGEFGIEEIVDAADIFKEGSTTEVVRDWLMAYKVRHQEHGKLKPPFNAFITKDGLSLAKDWDEVQKECRPDETPVPIQIRQRPDRVFEMRYTSDEEWQPIVISAGSLQTQRPASDQPRPD